MLQTGQEILNFKPDMSLSRRCLYRKIQNQYKKNSKSPTRCKHDGDRIYGGPNCTLVAERRGGFSFEQIIAAAVGAGGSVVLVSAIVLVVVLCRRRIR